MFPPASNNCQETKLQIYPNNHTVLRKYSQKCDTWALKTPRRCLEEPWTRRSSLFVPSSQLSPYGRQISCSPNVILEECLLLLLLFSKIGELIVW